MKSYSVFFALDALTDLKQAKLWYNQQQKGLGKRLQNDIRKTLDQIKRNPYYEPVQYAKTRIASCSIFPYSLHYEVDDDTRTVFISIIVHQHKKPSWLPDLSNELNEDEENE